MKLCRILLKTLFLRVIFKYLIVAMKILSLVAIHPANTALVELKQQYHSIAVFHFFLHFSVLRLQHLNHNHDRVC